MYFQSILKFFFLVAALGELKAQNSFFELNGEVINSNKGDRIYLFYKIDNKIFIDSSEIKFHSFLLKGKIEFPVQAFISNSKEFPLDGINSSIIYLDSENGKLRVDYKNFNNLYIENFKTYDEYLSLLKIKNLFFVERDSVYNLMKRNKKLLSANEKNSNIEVLELELLKLNSTIQGMHFREIEFDFDFCRKNNDSFVSPNLLLFWIRRKESVLLYDRIGQLYNELTNRVKESYSAKELKRTLENLKNSNIGEMAPGFSLKDINQDNVTLDSFKGEKVILLDFWASWCAPCREDFPDLKEAYDLYSSKGFEIISISKDNDLKSWKEAIKHDVISKWRHVSIKENYQSNLEELFFVNSIPVKVLISKDGEIIGRWRGGGTENREELNNLLKRILK